MADTLMTHFIAGYPTVEDSLKIGRALIAGGASYLEMQIPYSDPTADGPVIAAACDKALEGGFRVEQAFDICRELTTGGEGVPVFLMSYGGIVYNAGVAAFAARAREAGAYGLIIPDLAPGSDEGLAAACRQEGLACVPVLIPGVSDHRIGEVMADSPEWVYLALRRGITGTLTELGEENMATLDKLRKGGVKIMAGFGIQQRSQVQSVAPHCDAVIVGSQVVRTVNGCPRGDYGKLSSFVGELIGR